MKVEQQRKEIERLRAEKAELCERMLKAVADLDRIQEWLKKAKPAP